MFDRDQPLLSLHLGHVETVLLLAQHYHDVSFFYRDLLCLFWCCVVRQCYIVPEISQHYCSALGYCYVKSNLEWSSLYCSKRSVRKIGITCHILKSLQLARLNLLNEMIRKKGYLASLSAVAVLCKLVELLASSIVLRALFTSSSPSMILGTFSI